MYYFKALLIAVAAWPAVFGLQSDDSRTDEGSAASPEDFVVIDDQEASTAGGAETKLPDDYNAGRVPLRNIPAGVPHETWQLPEDIRNASEHEQGRFMASQLAGDVTPDMIASFKTVAAQPQLMKLFASVLGRDHLNARCTMSDDQLGAAMLKFIEGMEEETWS